MRVFITSRGQYIVMPLSVNIVETICVTCKQAVEYVQSIGKAPVYQWEV